MPPPLAPPSPGIGAPPRRPLRAGVAAAVATTFGAVGHLLTGGSLSAGLVAVALGVAIVPAWVLSGRERGWAWIAGLQIATQQLVHTALSMASAPGFGEPTAAGLLPHDLMLHAHILAGLLTAVALRAGERRIWAGARALATRLARWWHRLVPSSSVPIAQTTLLVTAPGAGTRPQRQRLRHAVVLRGPPQAA